MPTTYAQALEKIGAELPPHLVADAEIPVLTGPQAQGDLLIVPIDKPLDPAMGSGLYRISDLCQRVLSIMATRNEAALLARYQRVPDEGIQVVTGEATGNTHWLHRGFDSPGVKWVRTEDGPDNLRIGIVIVPDGQTAELIHTDEHGANAIGPGSYAIHGKREQAEIIRRVLD